ncbi:MAG: hypothetical protein ABIP48_06460 [Planctomycetota bacterium]
MAETKKNVQTARAPKEPAKAAKAPEKQVIQFCFHGCAGSRLCEFWHQGNARKGLKATSAIEFAKFQVRHIDYYEFEDVTPEAYYKLEVAETKKKVWTARAPKEPAKAAKAPKKPVIQFLFHGCAGSRMCDYWNKGDARLGLRTMDARHFATFQVQEADDYEFEDVTPEAYYKLYENWQGYGRR